MTYHTLNVMKCLKHNYWKLLLLSRWKLFTKNTGSMHLFQTKLLHLWYGLKVSQSYLWHFIVLFEGSDQFWNFHLGNWPREAKLLVKEIVWMKKLFQDPDLHLSRSDSTLKYFSLSYELLEKQMLHHILQQT